MAVDGAAGDQAAVGTDGSRNDGRIVARQARQQTAVGHVPHEQFVGIARRDQSVAIGREQHDRLAPLLPRRDAHRTAQSAIDGVIDKHLPQLGRHSAQGRQPRPVRAQGKILAWAISAAAAGDEPAALGVPQHGCAVVLQCDQPGARGNEVRGLEPAAQSIEQGLVLPSRAVHDADASIRRVHRQSAAIRTDGERVNCFSRPTGDRPPGPGPVKAISPRPPRPPPQARTFSFGSGHAVMAAIATGGEKDRLDHRRGQMGTELSQYRPLLRRRGSHGEKRGIGAVCDPPDRPRLWIEHGDGIVQPGRYTPHFDRQGPSLDRGILLEERHRHPQVLCIERRLQ